MELQYGVPRLNLNWKNKSNAEKVVRTIYGAPYNAHTEPIFKHLKIVKFEDLYKLHVAKFTSHFMRRELPIPLAYEYLFSKG